MVSIVAPRQPSGLTRKTPGPDAAPGCSLLIRLESRGWISANWGTSTNNRRARFYTLTRSGRKQLVAETTKWRRLAAAIGRVLGPETES